MAGDLESTIGSIESEGPSPEFVAELRARIEAETGELSPTEAVSVPELELAPEDDREDGPARTRWLGLAAAVLVLVVGVFARYIADDSESEQLDSVGSAEFVADAEPLTAERVVVQPGTHRIDAVGTPLTFTIDEPQFAHVNTRGTTELGHATSHGGADRVLTITRLSELVDPAEPVVAPQDFAGDWPADDFAGWADAVTGEIVLSDPEQVMVGGFDATRVDLELGETGCRIGEGICTVLGTNGADEVPLRQGAMYRIWVVDQGPEDPVVLVAAIPRRADVEWFDTVESVLSTLAFGAVEPNPVVGAPDGPVELPFLGGIRVELGEGSFALRDPSSHDEVVLEDWRAHSSFLSNPSAVGGAALSTPADVATAIRSGGSEVTAVGSTSVGGFDAQVYDVVGASSGPTLRVPSGRGDGWTAPVRGRLWLVDHPDRGLLMITAEAPDNVDVAFPLVLDNTETMIETLEFGDFG